MITIKYPVNLLDTYPPERIGALRDLLLFDIETTGFSGDASQLYLISCTYHDGSDWGLVQWFTDIRESEAQLLTISSIFMERFKTLVHFNRGGFDTPCLLKCCRRLDLDYNFNNIANVNIYEKIKPHHKLLDLENMRQKSIRQFLGTSREDKYSGGQLAEVCRDYLVTYRPPLYSLLIPHNENDSKGMPSILLIPDYVDMMEAPFALSSQQPYCADGIPDPFLNLTWRSPYSILAPLEYDTVPVSLELHRDVLTYNIALYQDELKYFCPNYRDYYYLPFEDTTVHKSADGYVDKDTRKRATICICYSEKCGSFLSQFGSLWPPRLEEDYKVPLNCVAYSPDLLSGPDSADSYARQILDYVNHKQEAQVPFSKEP